MSRHVIKIVPAGRFDLEGRQAWLEEMAREEGLFVEKLGEMIATFRQGEKRAVRYRLEPVRDPRGLWPPEELEAFYAEYGWTYCCRSGFFYLFSAEDEEALELYTDEDSRAASMEALNRILTKYARRDVAPWAVIAGLILLLALRTPGTALSLLPVFLGLPVTLVLSVIYHSVQNFKDASLLRKIRQGLSDGGGFRYPGRSRGKGVVIQHTVGLCVNTVLVCVLALFFLNRSQVQPLVPDSQYLMLPQMEQEENFPNGIDGVFAEDLQDENLVTTYLPTALLPEHRTVEQRGYGAEMERGCGLPLRGGGKVYRYIPHLRTEYLRLSIPALSKVTAKALAENLRYANVVWQMKEVEYPGTDFVLLGVEPETGYSELAVIAHDGRIVAYRYNGAEDLAEHLSLLAAPVIDG